MKRNPEELGKEEFDVLIVGGGIYGAAALWDATLRGLKAALIEKGDFGSQTSSNSLKIIHGGLRYIQHLDYKRMRESIHERRILMFIAPHLVHPLKCLIPTYGHLGKGPEALRIALLINDIVGLDRNKIADPQKHLPGGEVVSIDRCLEMAPGIRRENLTGGAVWHDCQVYNSERLLMGYLRAAVARGAVCSNYVEATGVIRDGDRIVGVEAVDGVSATPLEIRSKLVINTTGPWLNETLNWIAAGVGHNRIRYSWAMNLVTRALSIECAVGVTGRRTARVNGELIEKGKKVYFIAPWRGYSLIGTIHEPYEGKPEDFKVPAEKIQQFVDEVNFALPENQIGPGDLRFVYSGLLPMDHPDEKSGEVVLTKHYKIYDHGKIDGTEGILSVLGVKYTTARDVAVKTIDLALKKLSRPGPKSQTDSTRIYGGEIERFNDFLQQAHVRLEGDFPEKVIDQLIRNYGSEYGKVIAYGQEKESLLAPIAETQVLAAEIVHAVQEEMAVHLTDAVWRRTELGSAGNPGETALRQAAEIMAEELGWDEERVSAEVSQAVQDTGVTEI